MPSTEAAHLELLAEIDAVTARLRTWSDSAPAWTPAATVQALVRRLLRRAESLRVRLEAPLVVATLGGTGTGKSTLINALAGAEVVSAGRSRPTTTRPTLIGRPQLTPEMLGIDPAQVEVVGCDLPALADLVLLDCPDPDTTEDTQSAATNLARLRAILPHCDVILVTATQQKYRSARVSDELAAAASGARLVFVQTHADCDPDIRDDWRRVLDPAVSPSAERPAVSPGAERPAASPSAGRLRYAPGEIFYVDSAARWPRPRRARCRMASSPACRTCSHGNWPGPPATAFAEPTSWTWWPTRWPCVPSGWTAGCRRWGRWKRPSRSSVPAWRLRWPAKPATS